MLDSARTLVRWALSSTSGTDRTALTADRGGVPVEPPSRERCAARQRRARPPRAGADERRPTAPEWEKSNMSVGQSVLLAFIAGFAYFSRRFMGDLFLERAIVLGPLTGLILGDYKTGLVVGASLELIFIGAADVGGSVPPNLPIGSILGTAFAIKAGLKPEQALVIAVPAALLGAFGELMAKAVSSFLVPRAERYAAAANTRGIAMTMHLGNLIHGLCIAIPAYLGLRLGTDAVKSLANGIQGPIQDGLTVAGAVLPALGFALLMNTLVTPALMPFFFMGFLLAAYTNFGVLGVALLGFMIAAVIVMRQGGVRLVRADETAGGSLVSKGDQRRLFWRSFAVQAAFSFDRMQAIGFTWGLMPLLKKLYPNPRDLSAALRRHLTFFNTHPWIPGPIYALVSDLEARHSVALAGAGGATSADVPGPARPADMPTGGPTMEPIDSPVEAADDEEPRFQHGSTATATATSTATTTAPAAERAGAATAVAAGEPDVTVQTIQGVKGSLMGPLAGVGDSTFHGTLRPIFSGIGASLGLQANLLAPLVFLLPVNAVHLVVRWVTQRAGFRIGSRLFERIDQSALKRLMEGASITGLMGVGALVGTWLTITVPVTYTQGKSTVKIEEMLDNIMPKLIPLLITLGVFWLVRRRVNAVALLIGLAIGGFALGALGVLGVPAD